MLHTHKTIQLNFFSNDLLKTHNKTSKNLISKLWHQNSDSKSYVFAFFCDNISHLEMKIYEIGISRYTCFTSTEFSEGVRRITENKKVPIMGTNSFLFSQ